MTGRPSDHLRKWLDTQLAHLRPGSKLPTDRQLAHSFGVSVRTVARVVSEYSLSHMLQRVPGKGTFVPDTKNQKTQSYRIWPQKYAHENLSDALKKAIGSGALKRGQPLPQIKYMCLKFRVSATTVSRAYALLEQEGYVSRVGKAFWVGSIEEQLYSRPLKEVSLIKKSSLDFSDIFTSNILEQAYKRLENELRAWGYYLHFESTEEFLSKYRMCPETKTLPHACVCFNFDSNAVKATLPGLQKIRTSVKKIAGRTFNILLDLKIGTILSPLPTGVTMISRGHISTSGAQAVVRYVASMGYKDVLFFINEAYPPLWSVLHKVLVYKIWAEAEHVQPDFSYRFIVKPEQNASQKVQDAVLDSGEYLGSYQELFRRRKYPEQELEQLQNRIHITHDFITEMKFGTRDTLWVFSHGSDAIRAYKRLIASGVRIPGDLSILCLENNPNLYHLGISHCENNYDSMGYMMAHSLIGAVPIERTSKGFMKTKTRIEVRSTSR